MGDIRNFFAAKGDPKKPAEEVDLTGEATQEKKPEEIRILEDVPIKKNSTSDTLELQSDAVLPADDDDDKDDKGEIADRANPTQASQTPKSATKTVKRKSPGSNVQVKRKSRVSTDPPPMLSENAEEAMRLVRVAIKSLPPQEDVVEALNFMADDVKYQPPDEPPNPGKGPVPVGHPDCLTGLTFVVTGVLESMQRDVFTKFVNRHGGRVTGSVSGKTNFLVVGDKCGRSKVNKAAEKEVDLITEDGVWSLVRATEGLPSGREEEKTGASVHGTAPAVVTAPARGATVSDSAAPTNTPTNAPTNAPVKTAQTTQQTFHAAKDQELWVDKYKPKTSADLVGNNQMVTNLKQWLGSWDAVHLHHSSQGQEMKKRGKTLENKKAVLLSGSPGIGKTSAALIIARECGYEPIEVNASDTRSKSDNKVGKGVAGKLSNMIREMSTNTAISFTTSKGAGVPKKRHCLIMDEVDGMAGGDRGGVADLIQTIKSSKVPIICICNDKYSQKLKSLRNHTIELDFSKPTAAMVSKRLRMICHAEGLHMNEQTMNAVIQNANGGDIRLILGTLQMIRRRTDRLNYEDASGAANTKDVEMSPFAAAQQILSNQPYSFAERMEFCFQDMDLVPLLVQENYINHNPAMSRNPANRLQVIAKAADCFSEGDVLSRSVRQYQNWSLLPAALAVGTVMPATYMKGNRETLGLYPGEHNFPRFSAWLGQNSSHNKCKRLLGELHTNMVSSGNFHADRTALRLDYCSVLKDAIIQPLVRKEKEGLSDAIGVMNDYAFKRDDLDALIDLTKFKTKAEWAEDTYKVRVPTAVKTAFTRAFNSQGIKVKNGAVLKDVKVSKKRKAAGGGGDDDEDDGGLDLDDGVMAIDEEEEEDVDTSALASKLGKKGVSLELKAADTGAKKKKGAGGTKKKPAAKKAKA